MIRDPGDLDVLVSRIAANDVEAFTRWIAGAEGRLRDSLRSFARHVDSEAVMQETLLRVWQVAPRFKPDGGPDGLLRLAIRIGRNLAVSELRRRRLAPMEMDALERLAHESGGRSVEAERRRDPLLRAAIEDCHRRMPPQPAAVFAARLASGGREPDERLADDLGMRKNTFLQNVTRAYRFLADCLRQRGVDLGEELA